jgi:hypothetical protein
MGSFRDEAVVNVKTLAIVALPARISGMKSTVELLTYDLLEDME